jgi:[ribosomal protein S18]-alanine N-acetyltransferase
MISLFRSEPYVLESLDVNHAAACAAIHAASFAHPWAGLEIAALIASEAVIADGAINARTNDLGGFVLSRCAADEAEILTIGVAARARKQGLGKLLLDHHMDRLRSGRIQRLFLEVDQSNEAARALYRKTGFEEVGRREAYYRLPDGSRATALVLRKVLI